MAAVLTTESLQHLGLAPGEQLRLVVRAVHVLPVEECRRVTGPPMSSAAAV